MHVAVTRLVIGFLSLLGLTARMASNFARWLQRSLDTSEESSPGERASEP